jgi:hypothetical protein
MAHAKKALHVLLLALTVHVWHMVTCDRFLDAAADVGLDKVATIALHVLSVRGE